ncbi:MAG: helix-turn-helix domain-containing protein [Dehalococcoidia bacterium]
MTANDRRTEITLAIGQRVPEFVRANVPEALAGVSSRELTRVPPSAIVLVMAHPGPCLLEEAAADAGYLCLRMFDPATPIPDIATRSDDLVFVGASREEILWRATRAREMRRFESPARPELTPDGLRHGSAFIPLSASEVRLLGCLIEGAGRPVTPQALALALGHPDVERRAIEAHLYRLRQKLRRVPALEIRTVRQRGYRWTVLERPVRPGSSSECSTP